MKKRLLAGIICFILVFSLAACGSVSNSTGSSSDSTGQAGSSNSGLEGKKIGFINAGADDYYAAFGDALVRLAKENGATVTELNSNYSSETELANCQDLISAGVDAIACITAGAAGSAATIKAANDADIPIFFVVGQPETESGSDYTGWVSDNYAMIGYAVGQWVGENYSDAKDKIALVPGVFGQNTAEAEIVGFNMALEEVGLGEAYVTASGEWTAAKAVPAVEDLISSGRDVEVIFACNEEMARGTIQVLEEKELQDDIAVVSINGKEEGWEWLEDGKMMATGLDCPILDADLSVQQMTKYFNGEEFEKDLNIKPSMVLTKDNLDKAIPWEMDEYLKAREAGQFKYDLSEYEKDYEENKKQFDEFAEKVTEYVSENN
ncbi:MAG: sugar ABC transporter substrate-binding protein [Hespellia sp.]|nr:sugar ABC transporter substrate-binding protein [Hespellia sp.]